MARRRARNIIIPNQFTRNSFYPQLAELAADLRSQEFLGGCYNLPRRWRTAYQTVLKEVLREKQEQALISIKAAPAISIIHPFSLSIPITQDELEILEWFRTQGHTIE